ALFVQISTSRNIQILDSGISVPSRRVSIVIIEHAAEPLSSSDRSCFCSDPFDWSDKPIFQPLMISFSVIMRNEFSDPVPQRLLTKEDHLLHAVFLDGANEPFRVCVQIGERGGSLTD